MCRSDVVSLSLLQT